MGNNCSANASAAGEAGDMSPRGKSPRGRKAHDVPDEDGEDSGYEDLMRQAESRLLQEKKKKKARKDSDASTSVSERELQALFPGVPDDEIMFDLTGNPVCLLCRSRPIFRKVDLMKQHRKREHPDRLTAGEKEPPRQPTPEPSVSITPEPSDSGSDAGSVGSDAAFKATEEKQRKHDKIEQDTQIVRDRIGDIYSILGGQDRDDGELEAFDVDELRKPEVEKALARLEEHVENLDNDEDPDLKEWPDEMKKARLSCKRYNTLLQQLGKGIHSTAALLDKMEESVGHLGGTRSAGAPKLSLSEISFKELDERAKKEIKRKKRLRKKAMENIEARRRAEAQANGEPLSDFSSPESDLSDDSGSETDSVLGNLSDDSESEKKQLTADEKQRAKGRFYRKPNPDQVEEEMFSEKNRPRKRDYLTEPSERVAMGKDAESQQKRARKKKGKKGKAGYIKTSGYGTDDDAVSGSSDEDSGFSSDSDKSIKDDAVDEPGTDSDFSSGED